MLLGLTNGEIVLIIILSLLPIMEVLKFRLGFVRYWIITLLWFMLFCMFLGWDNDFFV